MNAPTHFDEMDAAMPALRVPPHSMEAEQSLLGALMLDNSAWDRIADVVIESDFYRNEHRLIFRAVSILIERGLNCDIVTVFEAMEKAKNASDVGGLAYLSEIANNTPSAVNARRYADIVRERSIQRKLIEAGDAIAGAAFDRNGRDIAVMLDEAESKIMAIRDAGSRSKSETQAIQPLLGTVVEHIQEMYSRGDSTHVTGLSTGLLDIDQKTGGIQPGDMVIIAGRPGMGKTSLALRIAIHNAVEKGKAMLFFSMEMPAKQIARRILADVSDIPIYTLKSGKLGESQWQDMTYGLGKLHQSPIYIDETGGLTPLELRARSRRMHRACKGNLGGIFIDYLQLMTTSRSGENRASELSEISRQVKNLGKELGVPIFALSQLNRGLEARQNKRPMASDLRESGALEQDADIIMFIYRDEVYNPDTQDKGMAEIIIGKFRDGETGTVRAAWQGRTASFRDLPADWKQKSNIQYSGYVPPED